LKRDFLSAMPVISSIGTALFPLISDYLRWRALFSLILSAIISVGGRYFP